MALYNTCKRMIERGQTAGMAKKLDIFYAANKLTDEQKEWVDAACKKATEVERETVYTMFKTSKEKVIADGAEVTAFEDMDIDAFKKIAEPIQEKFAKDNGMEEELEMVKKANPANK